MKKLLFIYHPLSGKALLKSKLSEVIDIFVKSGYEVIAYPTQKYKDAYRKTLEYDGQDVDLIVCSGGDGTLDEVVTAMMQCENKKPIGYIPSGTTNDFASSLQIPTSILQAADVSVNGAVFSCDVGQFNDCIFVYIAAFGLFTDVSYQTNQDVKNILGHFAYVLEGAKRIFNVPSYHMKITHDGEVIEGDFIFGMITNSRSVGGFRSMVGRKILFDDGVFEVCLIKTPKNALELNEIIAALLIEQVDTKHMYNFKASHIEFESEEEISWTLDGEFGGSHDQVFVDNLRQQLEIMVPRKQLKKLSCKACDSE
jgi:YegS/Rv2252/BmrU family lipid kinase